MVAKAATPEKKKRTQRKEQSGETNSAVWNCKVCVDQYFGGPRCPTHSPTPEQREANPDAYPRIVFAVALRSPDAQVRCRACSWFGSAGEGTVTKKSGSQARINCPRCKQTMRWVAVA